MPHWPALLGAVLGSVGAGVTAATIGLLARDWWSRHAWWVWECPRCGRRVEVTRPWHRGIARSLHVIICPVSTVDGDGGKNG